MAVGDVPRSRGDREGHKAEGLVLAASRPERRPDGCEEHGDVREFLPRQGRGSKAGYDEALLLAPDGHVSECTGENVFVVRSGRIISPPGSDAGALPGITQESVETIARDLGIEVCHEPLVRTDLYTVDESFLTGTAAEVVPIREVDDRKVGDGTPGPITRQLQQIYFAAGARRGRSLQELARTCRLAKALASGLTYMRA